MTTLEKALLSRDEARSLTDEVKGDAERLWRKLVELYEGGAHEVLGYSSWGAYFKTEFGGSRSQAYKLLDAGRVAASLTCENGSLNARQAVELAPLLKQPDALRDAWAEVVEANPEPTAADVRAVVKSRVADRETPRRGFRKDKDAPFEITKPRHADVARRARDRLVSGLSEINGICRGLSELDYRIAAAGSTHEEIATFARMAASLATSLRAIKTNLTEALDDE